MSERKPQWRRRLYHKDRRFYTPSDQGYEAEVKERVEKRQREEAEE